MAADPPDLPLFRGEHVPRIRCENALARLQVAAALAAAPDDWRDAVAALAGALDASGPSPDATIRRLDRCRRDGWPAPVERAWQRLVGRALDARAVPGTLHGQPAAAFLLRGGERERAHASLLRHLHERPCDTRAWRLCATFEPVRAAARCGFHGGPLLDAAADLADAIDDDGLAPVARWLLPYAWFDHAVDLEELGAALRAENLLDRPPLPTPGDPFAFAWYLVDAGGRGLAARSVGVVEARGRLQRVSPVAFRRYLRRVEGGRL